MKIFDHFLGFRRKKFPLSSESLPIVDLKLPSTLSLAFSGVNDASYSSLAQVDDEIESGQAIWEAGAKRAYPSPVKGKVVDMVNVPDIRGRGLSPSIIVEPESDTSSTMFPPLEVLNESRSTLKKRIEEAGSLSDHIVPRPLIDLICPESGVTPKAIIILAVDREPGVSAFTQLFRERSRDSILAAALLGKIARTKRIFIALPQTTTPVGDILDICQENNVNICFIPPEYPESLDSMVASRAGVGVGAEVIGVEAALAAFDAVSLGKIQDKKTLTLIGRKNKAIGNYRVNIGSCFKDIFLELGIKPREGDKVVVGGPMGGFAQYSLEGAVDSGVNSIMLLPESSAPKWKNDPCVNCGKCVDICPVNIQAHLIGLYSEFGLFERAKEFEIEQCLECGLCASVCVAGRPLVQFIDLAKKEISKLEKEELQKKCEEEEPNKAKKDNAKTPNLRLAGKNPAMSIFSGEPKFTVGFAPHWRTKANLTKMNIAFILALLPTIITGAFSQFFGSEAVALDASFGPINGFLKTLVVEMGLNAGFLWFSGVLGAVVFSMGLGVLVEYLCQLIMRQPYHATNGHGALMGLLIALLMPPSVPLWVMAAAVTVAIFVGKQIFGGIGAYPMHPALVGWLVILLSWPQYVYPIGGIGIASINAAAILATAAGGLILWSLGYIRIEAPLGVLIGTVMFYFVFQDKLDGGIAEQLLTGHVVLAAFFLATDPTTSPANKLGLWIYGIGLGALIMLIRAYGVWPDAVPFAVLLMNILCPLIDRLRPRVKKLLI